MNQPKLRELIMKAQNGDQEALMELINRFMPLVKKYGHGMPDDEARLILIMTEAIKRYRPNTTWGRDELNRAPGQNQK